MRIEVETGARTRTVHVAGASGRLRVDVDGRRREVDAVALGGGTWSLLIDPAAAGRRGGRSYEVGIVERGGGELTVHVNGRVVPVRTGGRWRRRGTGAAAAATGPQRILAPMPGRVVKVLVQPGDAVEARQGLVVVEAMKMENELRAARPGTVREVRVAEGSPVEANTVMVVID